MKKIVLLTTLILLSNTVFSQIDSIQDAILKHSETKSILISKGRALLLDKFIEGDLNEVKKIKNYLKNDVENNDYVAFYPAEYWALMYWTKEYAELLNSITKYDSINIIEFNKKIKPLHDFLYMKIKNKSIDSLSILESNIQDSKLNGINKEFLTLNLKGLISGNESSTINQDTLNLLSDNFLNKYPNSEHEQFIRKYIRHKRIPSNWGFGYEFFSGYGLFTDELKANFKDNIPIGVAFDISYKKFNLYLRDYIGFSKTKNNISYSSGIWEKDSQVRVIIPEASIGYTVLDNKYLTFAPFAGISGTIISATEHDINIDGNLDTVEKNTISYTAGLNFDIKLKKKINRHESSFWFLRVRYGYTLPQFDNKYLGYSGNMHYITIGFGQFGRFMKDDY